MAGGTEVRNLAQNLLAQEAGTLRAPEDVVRAAVAVCGKLHLEVGQFIGTEGFRVLLSRALHLARVEFPFLESVRVGTCDDGDCWIGLADIIPQREATEILESIVAVLGGFIELLRTFIGEDLTLRMIHRRWPDVPRVRFGREADEGRRDG